MARLELRARQAQGQLGAEVQRQRELAGFDVRPRQAIEPISIAHREPGEPQLRGPLDHLFGLRSAPRERKRRSRCELDKLHDSTARLQSYRACTYFLPSSRFR